MNRELQLLTTPAKSFGGGYFAATVGDNTSPELAHYLDRQGTHHGYDQRANPPVWTQTWPFAGADHAALQTAHAVTVLSWHLVFSTWNRQGVFTRQAGQAVCDCWERYQADWRIRLQKVSVLPDHIHIALRSHPTVVPAELVLEMLNRSQELVRERFGQLVVQAGIPRVWKPGAYTGSFGDITKVHVRNYLRQWERGQLA
jgi:putative transposase